jgi:hypothetical protein
LKECAGEHKFFVGEVVGVPSEGTVHVIRVCTFCPEAIINSFPVSKATSELILGNQKKEK